MKDNKWKLLLKYFSYDKKMTEADLNHLSNDAELKTFKKTLNRLLAEWESRPVLRSDIQLWQQLKTRIDSDNSDQKNFSERTRPKYTYTFMRYAAVVLIAIGIGYFMTDKFRKWPVFNRHHLDEYVTVKVKPMQRLQIRLSDDTTVMLDAGSEFRYPQSFEDKREVELKGEAYFQVAHDASNAFIVKSGNAYIEVLGTKFNVRSWDESPQVAVVVSEGKVKLKSSDQTRENFVILTKGLKSTLSTENKLSKPEKVDTEEHLLWMNNGRVFRNVPVVEIFAQLERWYGYTFSISDPEVGKQKITVELKASNVNNVLELISIITHTKIERDANHIKLISK